MAATTLPTLLLGGEVPDDPEETFAGWRQALRAARPCTGLVVGRTLLYPPDDDVAAAVDTAVSSAVSGERRCAICAPDASSRRRRGGRRRSTSRAAPAGATPACGSWTCRPAAAHTLAHRPRTRWSCCRWPASCAVTVRRRARSSWPAGAGVFAGVTDFAYLPRRRQRPVTSPGGGTVRAARRPAPTAACRRRLRPRPRRAGRAARRGQLLAARSHNFCMPGVFEADR